METGLAGLRMLLRRVGTSPMVCVATALLGSLGIAAESAAPGSARINWRSIGPGQFGAMFGVAVSPHDPNVIVAGVDMGNAFMTRDRGKTWRILGRSGGQPLGNPGYRGTWGVHFDPKRPERIWIGSTHGVFLSTDDGANWRMVLGGGADSITHAITTDPSNPDIVYAANGNGGRNGVSWCQGEVWKSTDGGENWELITPANTEVTTWPKGRNWVAIAVDPQSPFTADKGHGRLYLSGQGGLHVSEDAGESWTSLEKQLPGGAVNIKPNGPYTSGICDLMLVPGAAHSTIFATIQGRYTNPGKTLWLGGVYASYDRGQTWVEKNNGLEHSLPRLAKGPNCYSMIAGCRAQPNTMYWAAWDGVYKTEDSGETWCLVTHLGTEWKKGPDFDGKEVYWRLRRHDSNFDQSYYCAYGPANGLACSPTNPDVVAYTDNAGIAVSYDGGAHWTEPGFEFGEAVWPEAFGDRPPMRLTHKVRSRGIQLIVPLDLAVDPFDPKTIAIGHCDVGLMISRDNGEWWEWAYRGILTGERNYIRAIAYDPTIKGRMWVAGGGWSGTGHVYRSDDGGRNFKITGIPQLNAEVERSGRKLYVHDLELVRRHGTDAATVYAATDIGIFTTADDGGSWTNGTVKLEAFPRVSRVVLDPTGTERVYAAAATATGTTGDAGLFRSDDGGRNWVRLGAETIGLVRSLSVCRTTGALYVIALAPGQAGYWSPRSLYHSADRGGTWAVLDDRFGACVAVHPADPRKLFYVTFAQDIRRDTVNVWSSADGGQNWRPVADDIPLSPGGTGNQIVFDATDSSRFFLLHNSGTYEGRENPPDTRDD